jgi:hypothetical protein
MERALLELFSPAEVPSRKTLRRIVETAQTKDRSGPWSLGASTPEEAALALPVLRAYLNITALRSPAKSPRDLYITHSEARWCAKIRTVAPDLWVVNVYRLARAYIARDVRGEPTYDLDALLAFRPWDETPITMEVANETVTTTSRQQYQKGVAEGWIPPAPPFFMHELAGIRWSPKAQHKATWVKVSIEHDPEGYDEAAITEADNG